MFSILKRQNNSPVLLVVIATGISSVVTQLLTIREFLAQFQGNEFVIALILFSWLIQGGIGTYLSQSFSKIIIPSPAILARLSLIVAGLPALQIILIRELRDTFFIHGSSVGFYPTFAFIFLTTAPYALLIGFVLPYSLFVLRTSSPDYPGSNIYITDNLGDIAGGALFSFFLVYFFSPLQSVFISNLLLLAATYFLFKYSGIRPAFSILCTGMVIGILTFGIVFEEKTLSPPEGRLVYYNESKYGRIEVHQDREQYTLIGDGVPLFSNQNTSIAEETIHYPLSQLSHPKHILVISSEGNIMEELDKYHPESIDYVELDPDLSDTLFRFGLIKMIHGLNVINQDGRAYLANSDKIYDAIILNLPEPETYQINRFYTDSFYAIVKKHLSSTGILSFSMEGYDNYLAEPQRQKISSVYNTLSRHFKNVLLLSGQNIYFLASQSSLDTDIPDSLNRKGISTSYVSSYYYGNVTDDRINQLKELIDKSTPINTDIYPKLMNIMFMQWFAKFSTSPFVFVTILSALCLFYLVCITKEEFVLFSTGCMAMGTEILIIFAFQIFYGYIYLKIGLIITVFLAGLLPGAWIGNRFGGNKKILLVITDAILILLTGILIIAFKQGGYSIPLSAFLIYGFIVSMTCGYQFPTALKLTGDSNSAVTKLFSADLIGAAAGTLLISVAVIPYFGIIWAATCLIGLKVISLTIMATKS
jgi:spermidine synthase